MIEIIQSLYINVYLRIKRRGSFRRGSSDLEASTIKNMFFERKYFIKGNHKVFLSSLKGRVILLWFLIYWVRRKIPGKQIVAVFALLILLRKRVYQSISRRFHKFLYKNKCGRLRLYYFICKTK